MHSVTIVVLCGVAVWLLLRDSRRPLPGEVWLRGRVVRGPAGPVLEVEAPVDGPRVVLADTEGVEDEDT